MPKKSSEIIYKSRLSISYIVMMVLASFFFIVAGISVLLYTQEAGVNWITIFPLGFIFFGALLMSNTLVLFSIIITKDYLVLNYPFIARKKTIEWKSISDVCMRFTTTKNSVRDYSFRTGKEIRIYANGENYRFSTFTIKDPEKLFFQLNKRLDSSLKKKMKNEYRETEQTFWKQERLYQRWMMKIVLPICLIILVLLWILKK